MNSPIVVSVALIPVDQINPWHDAHESHWQGSRTFYSGSHAERAVRLYRDIPIYPSRVLVSQPIVPSSPIVAPMEAIVEIAGGVI